MFLWQKDVYKYIEIVKDVSILSRFITFENKLDIIIFMPLRLVIIKSECAQVVSRA